MFLLYDYLNENSSAEFLWLGWRSIFSDTIEGDDDDNIIIDHWGSRTLYGHGGNDFIYGGGGNDIIFGGTGNDYLLGGRGRDTINGEEGDDLIYGGRGRDSLNGGAGDDTFLVKMSDIENDEIHGGSGSDTLDFSKNRRGVEFDLRTVENRLPEGLWTLTVIDDFPFGDQGDIDGWGIEFETTDGFFYYENLSGGPLDNPLGQNLFQVMEIDTSELRITGQLLNIKVVLLGVDHDWLGDLDVYLEAPNGNTVELFTDILDNNQVPLEDATIVLDDQSPYVFEELLTHLSLYVQTESGNALQGLVDALDGDPDARLTSLENLVGTRKDDILTGDDGDNIIDGNGGEDIINALDGDDKVLLKENSGIVNGGAGNDTLSFENAKHGVEVELYEDTDSVQMSTFTGGDAGEGLDFVAEGDNEFVYAINFGDNDVMFNQTGDAADDLLLLTSALPIEGFSIDDLGLVGGFYWDPGRYELGDSLNDNALDDEPTFDGEILVNGGVVESFRYYDGQASMQFDVIEGEKYKVQILLNSLYLGQQGWFDTLTVIDGVSYSLFPEFNDGSDLFHQVIVAEVIAVDSTLDIELSNYDPVGGVLLNAVTVEHIDSIPPPNSGFENLIGSTKNDILTGNSLDNIIDGNGGEDVVDAREGNDLVLLEDDDSFADGGEGQDTLSFENAEHGVEAQIYLPPQDTAQMSIFTGGDAGEGLDFIAEGDNEFVYAINFGDSDVIVNQTGDAADELLLVNTQLPIEGLTIDELGYNKGLYWVPGRYEFGDSLNDNALDGEPTFDGEIYVNGGIVESFDYFDQGASMQFDVTDGERYKVQIILNSLYLGQQGWWNSELIMEDQYYYVSPQFDDDSSNFHHVIVAEATAVGDTLDLQLTNILEDGFTIINAITVEHITGEENPNFVNFESLVGSVHDDVLIGNDVNNEINGLGGADTILGKGGNDTITAVAQEGLVVDGGAGFDELTLEIDLNASSLDLSVVDIQNIEKISQINLIGSSIVNVIGTNGNDDILTDSFISFDGGDGIDVLTMFLSGNLGHLDLGDGITNVELIKLDLGIAEVLSVTGTTGSDLVLANSMIDFDGGDGFDYLDIAPNAIAPVAQPGESLLLRGVGGFDSDNSGAADMDEVLQLLTDHFGGVLPNFLAGNAPATGEAFEPASVINIDGLVVDAADLVNVEAFGATALNDKVVINSDYLDDPNAAGPGVAVPGYMLIGDLGDDILVGSDGGDIILGGVADYSLASIQNRDLWEQTDLIISGAGDDVIKLAFDETLDFNELPNNLATPEFPLGGLSNGTPIASSFDENGIPINESVYTYNTVYAGEGDDTIWAACNKLGFNLIYGGEGNDELIIACPYCTEVFFGGAGNDKISSFQFSGEIFMYAEMGEGDDVLDVQGIGLGSAIYGGDGVDTFNMGNMVDGSAIYGGDGEDILNVTNLIGGSIVDGGAGDDIISVRTADSLDDVVYGGDGEDTFVVGANNIGLKIGDFEIGPEHDRFDLRNVNVVDQNEDNIIDINDVVFGEFDGSLVVSVEVESFNGNTFESYLLDGVTETALDGDYFMFA